MSIKFLEKLLYKFIFPAFLMVGGILIFLYILVIFKAMP